MRTPSCLSSAAFLLAAVSSGENTPDFSRASMMSCTIPAVNSGWPGQSQGVEKRGQLAALAVPATAGQLHD